MARNWDEVIPGALRRQDFLWRFWEKINTEPVKDPWCWEWTGAHRRHGYGAMGINYHMVVATRIMWTAVNGMIPVVDGKPLFVLHRCDNPKCVRPEHLFLGNHQANMDDRTRKGRAPTGDRNGARIHPGIHQGMKHHNAILDDNTVLAIREASANGVTVKKLAIQFGLKARTIYAVRDGQNWGHLPNQFRDRFPCKHHCKKAGAAREDLI